MSRLIRYGRGFIALVSIGAIVASIFPLSKSLDQPSGRQFDRIEESSLSNHLDDDTLTSQLSPRALPEGVTLSVDAAICEGALIIQRLNGAGNTKDASIPPNGLEGWSEEVRDVTANRPDNAIASAIGTLFPGSTNKRFDVLPIQNRSYRDVHGIERVSKVHLRAFKSLISLNPSQLLYNNFSDGPIELESHPGKILLNDEP